MIERRVLSKEEQEIRDDLLRLSEMVRSAIDRVANALVTLDTTACETVVAGDKNVNALHNQIEAKVLTTIATQQPVATDLRVLVAAMHINLELERIADHIAGIAATIINIAKDQPVSDLENIVKMATDCNSMLEQAIQSYMAYDADQAVRIAALDQNIDSSQTVLTNHIIQQMCAQPSLVPFGSRVLWIVHAIERIGDRTTNICEQIAYIKHGEIPDLNP